MKRHLFFAGVAFWLVSCAQPTESPPTLTIAPTVVENPLPILRSANGIDMELIGFNQQSAFLTTEICYEPPNSSGRWKLDEIVLLVDEYEIPSSIQLIESDSKRLDGFLCNRVDFPFSISPTLSEVEIEVKLVVERLITEVSGKEDCLKAQKNLDEANTGIVIECDLTSNSFVFSILRKPQTMTSEEALKLANDAFSEIVQGPWEFPFTIKQP
jgi:hypothetical protein